MVSVMNGEVSLDSREDSVRRQYFSPDEAFPPPEAAINTLTTGSFFYGSQHEQKTTRLIPNLHFNGL